MINSNTQWSYKAIGSFPKYLSFQLFFITYILTIFIPANIMSDYIYSVNSFFYLLPLFFGMLFTHNLYLCVKQPNVRKPTRDRLLVLLVLSGYLVIWYLLFY